MRRIKHKTKRFWLVGVLLVSMISNVSCAYRIVATNKALPPCNEEDGEFAYDKTGKRRSDGLFVNWQCWDRMHKDLNAFYGDTIQKPTSPSPQ